MERARSPFADVDYVAQYEQWYATPFGRVADQVERAMIVGLLRPLGRGASLLEIGCGTGHFSAALADAGFRMSGVDPSHAMLAAARIRVPVVCGAGQRLPFRDGAFDGALIIAVLEFVPDPAALLREARRVARTRVVVLTVSPYSWLGLRRRVSGWLGHPVFARAKFRSRAAVRRVALESGAPIEALRTGLFLPPLLAGSFARLEQALARRSLPGGGILGFTLRGSEAAGPRSLESAAPRD